MRRRLGQLYWAGVLFTVLTAALAVAALAAVKIADTRDSLLSILSTASAWTEESTADLGSLARRIADSAPPLRVTFLLPQGIVLADSEEAPGEWEDSLQSPEIQAALEGASGTSLRYSSARGAPTMYAAARLSPRLILRLSYPMHEIIRALWVCAAVFLVLFGLFAQLYRRTMNSFSRELIGQLERIEALLAGSLDRERLAESAFFPELRPSMQSICYRIERLHTDLTEIDRTQRLRRDFAANASHELKSPLTSIQGFAELLSEGMADTPEEQALYLDCILKEAERMRALIDDILLLSRSEMKTDEPLAQVRVEEVAREVAQALQVQCQARGMRMTLEGSLHIQAVEKDVWEILYNLMSNAVRYGREGGSVRVALGEGRLTVEDDGIGIAPEHLSLIFEQFYRVDKGRSREAGGTGLGLSIAAQLTRKYGGEIWAESEEGRGSRFIVSFVRNR